LHQVRPSYILSMPYIFKEPWTLRSINGNSNKTSPLKTIDKRFEISCLNPNFAAHWRYVLKVPLQGKKPQIEYFEKKWRALMTR
jgi:hypothetical protein